MVSFLPLPDWVPWWVHVAVLSLLGLFALMLLLMPFSVFGTKARLEAIEARLDEIQGEIRTIALRMPDSRAAAPIPDAPQTFRDPARYPPVPPPPQFSRPAQAPPTAAGRTEPRLF